MSTTTVARVDASHPVLAQLVDAATRGFTGSVEVSTRDSADRDLQVAVWLDGGAIYAVHANGWTPPDAAYVLYRTGEDFSGRAESPFQAAYETLRDGVPLLDADQMDVARRDWAYGLLAASLTWAKPRIHRTRKAMTDSNRIKATDWPVITTDMATRTAGLESAWRVVCDALVGVGITPVSAARACGVLAVFVQGSGLFTGDESLDQAAGRRGLSRAAVLEELSRAILSGASPRFTQAPSAEVQLLVPEHWEDPARAWGWVDEAPGAVLAVVDDADMDVEAELEAQVAPAPYVETPVTGEPAEAQYVPYLAPEPEPYAAPARVAVAPGSARELFQSWLGSSLSSADASIRQSIVQRIVDSAHAEAAARHQDVARAQIELDRAAGDASSAAGVVANARALLGEANDALDEAEADVARVRQQFARVMARAAEAAARASATAAQAQAEEAALASLREQVAAQEALSVAATRSAEQAAREQVAAQGEVDQTTTPALTRVMDAAEMIRITAVAPAQSELDAANQRAAAAAQAAATAGQGLEANVAAADQAQAIADALNFE